jgi:serine protease
MMLVVKFMMSCDLRRAVSLRAFDLKIYGLIILLLSFLLQGCGISNDALLDDDLVKIVYVSKENIIPAQWVFSTETDETLASVQWQFSDGSVSNRTPEQDQNVEHTFNRAGFHIIKLQYETASGQQGTSERGVNIRSGEISGKIFAASNTLVDVDTREPNEPNRENNSFTSAQPLATNTRLSGVVDVSDSDDFYQVQLQKDQTINLQVADEVNRVFESIQFQVFSSADTDNPLFNTTTDVGSGHLKVPFIVPANGRYFIQLTAVSPSKTEVDGKYVHSHGNYSLHIEAATGGADFVAGELIVMMKESIPNTVQAQSSLQKRPNGLIKRMDLGRIKTFSLTNARQFMAARNINYSASLDNNSRWQTLQAARLLAAQDDVLYAEPNWKRYPTALAAVTDPLYTSQWHYDSINLESAWQAMGSRGSADVTVAVLDTGVLTAHPDLSDNLIAGYDFIERDENANDPGDKSNGGQSSSFHGTHVAGTIAASNNDIGGTGIAPGVKNYAGKSLRS